MTQCFNKIFNSKKAFVGYLTIGDGGYQKSLAACEALIAGGVNILELGMPFCDPIADGPVIQAAATRALKEGTTLETVLTVAQSLRTHHEIPLILFSYYNPLWVKGLSQIMPRIKMAGIDALLIVDLPFEEAQEVLYYCEKHELLLIFVVTSATSNERLQQILPYAQGFIYYACQKGTTGIRDSLPEDFSQHMTHLKSQTDLPIVVGFGISSGIMAQTVLKQAEGFVVGSYFVKQLQEGVSPQELTSLAQAFLASV